jgi:hypothetical protein
MTGGLAAAKMRVLVDVYVNVKVQPKLNRKERLHPETTHDRPVR